MSAMQDGFFDKNGISALSLPESIHEYCISEAFSNLHGSNLHGSRVGGGITARKYRKGCTVLRGNREMTEKYEYSSTVPRTFLQD